MDEWFCLRCCYVLTVLFLCVAQNQKGQPGLVISDHSAALKLTEDRRKGLVPKHHFAVFLVKKKGEGCSCFFKFPSQFKLCVIVYSNSSIVC